MANFHLPAGLAWRRSMTLHHLSQVIPAVLTVEIEDLPMLLSEIPSQFDEPNWEAVFRNWSLTYIWHQVNQNCYDFTV